MSKKASRSNSPFPFPRSDAARAAANRATAKIVANFPPGLSQPALRALAGAGIVKLSDLTKITEAQLAALHGMGPKGVRVLREALAAEGQRFAK